MDYIKTSSNSVSVLPLWCPNSQFWLISIFILEVTLPGSHDVFSTWMEYGVRCQECSTEKKRKIKRTQKPEKTSKKNEWKHWASKMSNHSGVPLQADYVIITSFLPPEGNAELWSSNVVQRIWLLEWKKSDKLVIMSGLFLILWEKHGYCVLSVDFSFIQF